LGDLHVGSGPAFMASHFLTILTGRKLPKIWHQREPEPSINDKKTVTRVVEQTGILERQPKSPEEDALMGSERHQPKPAATVALSGQYGACSSVQPGTA
jgi:hypothetical protein